MRIASWVGRAVGMLPLPLPPLLPLELLLSPKADVDDAAEEEDAVEAEREAAAGEEDDFVMMIVPTCHFDL